MKTILRGLFALALLATSLLAADYNRVPAGQIKGARLSWVSTTAIKIGAGYGEVSGSYWEIGVTDTLVTTGYTLTGLSATANGVFQYIYIDRANSSFPDVTVRNSTTAPTWSDTFLGWYDGADRCIGAVWVEPAGTLLNFMCPDDITYHARNVLFLSSSTVTTGIVWNTLDISAYTPVNTSEAYFLIQSFGSWTSCTVGVTGVVNGPYTNSQASGVSNNSLAVWVPFTRGATRELNWFAYASSTTGTLRRYVAGYRIER